MSLPSYIVDYAHTRIFVPSFKSNGGAKKGAVIILERHKQATASLRKENLGADTATLRVGRDDL